MQAISDTSLRATLRALAGRFGMGEPMATNAAPGFPFYEVGRHEASSEWETDTDAAQREFKHENCRRAAAEARQLDLLRANAQAAYASVQGSHLAALDLALSVYEVELRALRARCDAHAEMLKTIRLYAQDDEARALAARGLDCCAEVLAARQLSEAGCGQDANYHS